MDVSHGPARTGGSSYQIRCGGLLIWMAIAGFLRSSPIKKSDLAISCNGWWELYTSTERLLDEIAKDKNASSIDSTKWLQEEKNS